MQLEPAYRKNQMNFLANPIETLGVEKVSNKIKNTVDGLTRRSGTAKGQLVSWKISLTSSPRMQQKRVR